MMKFTITFILCLQSIFMLSCGRRSSQDSENNIPTIFENESRAVTAGTPSNIHWPSGYSDMSGVAQKFENISKSLVDTSFQFTVKSYGQSLDGRDLAYGRFSQKNAAARQQTILLSSGLHGDELIAVESMIYYAEQIGKHLKSGVSSSDTIARVLSKYDLVIVPVVCPDGFANISRYSNGEDQNRSFPTPQDGVAGELNPCVSSFMNLYDELNVKSSVDFHAFGGRMMYPWSYISDDVSSNDKAQFAQVVSQTTKESGYKSGQISQLLYPSDGTGVDYFYWKRKSFATVVEIDSKRMVPAQENIPQIVEGVKSLTDQFLDSYLSASPLEGTTAPQIDYSKYIKLSGAREFVMSIGRRSVSNDPASGFMNLRKQIEGWMAKPVLVNLDSIRKISQQVNKNRIDFVMASAYETNRLLKENQNLDIVAFGTYGKEKNQRISNRCLIVSSSRGSNQIASVADLRTAMIVIPRSLTTTCIQHFKTTIPELTASASVVDLANTDMNMDDAIEKVISEGGAVLVGEQDYLAFAERKPGRAQEYLKIIYQTKFSFLSDLVLLKSKVVSQEVSAKLLKNMKELSRVEKLSLGINDFEDSNADLLRAQGELPTDAVR